MKYALLFLLSTGLTHTMQDQIHPDLLTQVPFAGNEIQLISFAQSIVCGTLKISDSHHNHLEFYFSDYRNPAITCRTSLAQAWDATRYMAAVSICNIMDQQEQIDIADTSNLSPETIERYKGCATERKAKYTALLSALNVSPSLTRKTIPQTDLQRTFEETSITSTDSEQEKASKTARIVAALDRLKNEPSFLREIAFTRFYRFWSCEDLAPQTSKDYQRDLASVGVHRRAFFTALEKKDVSTLALYRNRLEVILKKQPRTLGQTVEKMIESLRSYKHLDSPHNSDEEIL